MMSIKSALMAIAVLCISCNDTTPISYDEAIAYCDRQRKELSLEAAGFSYVQPDCLIGARLPDVQAETVTGKKIDSNYFSDKVSIINFWFIACAPCVAEIPGFKAIVDIYGKDHVNYLAIGRDTRKDVEEFLEGHAWPFDHIADGNALIKDVFHSKWGYPLTLIADQTGTIVRAFTGGRTDSTAADMIQEKIVPFIESALSDQEADDQLIH